MSNKFDVSKIRAEVDSRKKHQQEVAERTGQPSAAPVSSMAFLRELRESVNSGHASAAVINKMKIVEQKAYEKNPIAPKPAQVLDSSMAALIAPSTQATAPRYNQGYEAINEGHENGDREGDMYRAMQRRNQDTLSRVSSGGHAVDNLVNEYYGHKPAAPQSVSVGSGLVLNERAINEEIDRKFEKYISESVNPIMEAAMKNTIIEIYSKERVKKALVELDIKSMVKELVLETIKELQERNKKKA